MQRDENNPNFFHRKPATTNSDPRSACHSRLDRPDNRNAGKSATVDTRRKTSKNFFEDTNTGKRSHTSKQNVSVGNSKSLPKPNSFWKSSGKVPNIKGTNYKLEVTHLSSDQNRPQAENDKKFQSRFNEQPPFKNQNTNYRDQDELYSVIRNKDTTTQNFVELQSVSLGNTDNLSNDSITKSNDDQVVDLMLSDNYPEAKIDYNSVKVCGDLNKLQMMTAKDFDRDRYAQFRVHEAEMKDYVRTVTFLNCIELCAKDYIKNKVVLVIRGGIGFLPLLCVRYGFAQKVIVLEQSACIEYARRVVKDNCFSHVITFIQSSVHELKELPYGIQQVDVILSDFMGDCVLSQGDQMEQVIEARDRFLKPNGLMIPLCVGLFGQLLEQKRVYSNQRIRKHKSTKHKINKNVVLKKKFDQSEIETADSDSSTDSTRCSWWSDVYGFDMRSKPEIIIDHNSEDLDEVEWCTMDEPLVTFFDPCKIVSTPCLIKEFDMYKCTIPEIRLVQCKNLKLKCVTPNSSTGGGDYAHMLELFMVVDFPNGQQFYDKNGEDQVGFSTSCDSPHTNYIQTGLLLQDQLLVVEEDEFIINEFHMWRGPQLHPVNNPFEKSTGSRSSDKSLQDEENLKIRLRYTFVNKYMKAIDRRCAYTLIKKLF